MLPKPLTKRLLSKVHINNMFHISKQRLRIVYSFMTILWLISITFIFNPPAHQKVSECLQRQLHNNQSMYCKCSLLICKTGFINFMQSPGLVKWSPMPTWQWWLQGLLPPETRNLKHFDVDISQKWHFDVDFSGLTYWRWNISELTIWRQKISKLIFWRRNISVLIFWRQNISGLIYWRQNISVLILWRRNI